MEYTQRIEPGLRAMLEAHGLMGDVADILPFSVLSVHRLKAVISALDGVAALDGDTAEIGAFRGGTTCLIAAINGGARHWACDTFKGLVDASDRDDVKNGQFDGVTASLDEIKARMLNRKNVRIVSGYFPRAATALMRSARYKFVHIDVDTYKSIHAAFGFFASRMVPGGVIAMDDVIGRGCRGAKTAWGEICAADHPQWEVFEQNDPQVMVRFKERMEMR